MVSVFGKHFIRKRISTYNNSLRQDNKLTIIEDMSFHVSQESMNSTFFPLMVKRNSETASSLKGQSINYVSQMSREGIRKILRLYWKSTQISLRGRGSDN